MTPINKKTKDYFFSTLLLICIFCFVTDATSQPLQYANLSFSEALDKAKITNQIVFVQLESDCQPCNSVADKGISGSEINELFSKFICIKASYNTEDYQKILLTYRIYPNLPSSIFVDSEGNYLSSLNNFSTTNRNEYFKLAAKALANKENPPFETFTKALALKEYNKELLIKYIVKLNEQNFNVEDLVGKYIDALTIKELENENELAFLIRTSPIINSKTFRLIRQNNDLYNKVFESFPQEDRKTINQKIIARSKEKAFREKDCNYMYAVSNFLSGSYGEDLVSARNASTKLELEFLKEMKDFKQYFNRAHFYYQNSLDKLNMDSVRIAEMSSSYQRPDGMIIKGGSLYHYGNILNEIAFSICEMSNDKEQLGFALKLSEKTLEYNMPAFIDTYARILYRLGGKRDAIYWQQKAVTISDSLHQQNNELEEVLIKMKNNTL